MHRRLGHDDEKAHHHREGNEPANGRITDLSPQRISRRQEPNVHAREKQHQPGIGVQQTDAHLEQASPRELQKQHLKDQEEQDDRQQRQRNLFAVFRNPFAKEAEHLCKAPGVLRLNGRVRALAGWIEHAEQQHREDRPDAAERNEAEAVVLRAVAAAHGSNADAERHDERHGDRPGRNPAGVKRRGKKALRRKGRKRKDHGIQQDQNDLQGFSEDNAQQRQHKEQPDADRDGQDEHHIRDGGHLPGQNRQIRLRNGDQHAD